MNEQKKKFPNLNTNEQSAGRQFIEGSVLAALVHCTIEQSTFFNKEFKRRDGLDFLKWKEDGFKLMYQMENKMDKSNLYVEEVKSFVHEAIYEFKTNLYKQVADAFPDYFTQRDIECIEREYNNLLSRNNNNNINRVPETKQ